MKMIKKSKKAFTLVELVVVIAIIAILSGVSVAVYVGITNNARKSAAQSEATSIGTVTRAAALMNADGFEFKLQSTDSKPNARAKWLSKDSKSGIQFETWQAVTEDTAAKYVVVTDPTGEMLRALYLAAEETDKFPGDKIEIKAEQKVNIGTQAAPINIVAGFTYTSNAAVEFTYTY